MLDFLSVLFILHTSIINVMMVQDSDSDDEIFNLLDPSVPGKVVGNIYISCSVEVYGIQYNSIFVRV